MGAALPVGWESPDDPSLPESDVKNRPRTTAAYAAQLSGAIVAHQFMLIALLKQLDIPPEWVDQVMANHQKNLASHDVQGDHTSDTHWSGAQEAYRFVRENLAIAT